MIKIKKNIYGANCMQTNNLKHVNSEKKRQLQRHCPTTPFQRLKSFVETASDEPHYSSVYRFGATRSEHGLTGERTCAPTLESDNIIL